MTADCAVSDRAITCTNCTQAQCGEGLGESLSGSLALLLDGCAHGKAGCSEG